VLSENQRKIVGDLQSQLTVLMLHAGTDPGTLAIIENCRQLLESLYVAPATEKGNKTIVQLHGRRITIFSERPKLGSPPVDVSAGILNCEADLCPEAFVIDVSIPNKKRFHDPHCRYATRNQEVKMRILQHSST
jgi:hypothetical protein